MKQKEKIRVAVLFGGRSAEHEVSLRSAQNVIQFLDDKQFDIVPIGIDKKGHWFLGQDVFAKSLQDNQVKAITHKDQTWFIPESISHPTDQYSKSIAKQANGGPRFDVIFPVMHGTLCEDGTLQGLLEIANLPYVGCGVLSSAIGMDKDVSKRLAIHAGIPVAPYLVVKQGHWEKNSDKLIKQATEKLGYPVFVKPVNTGSSIGITKVKTKEALTSAINEAFRFDTKVIIEKALNVLELEVAVLESLEPDSDPIVSVVGEIKPRHEFYSYDAKYLDENGAELLIPAPVSEEIKEKARAVAKELFQVLDCEGMARVDLFYDKDTQQICFNEVNTIPGFTQISMYPKLMAASGISYSELLTHLIQLAIQRHEKKSQLIRSYAD